MTPRHQQQHTEAYLPERVLVTGGAGFIGSHVVERLASRGYHVVVLDKLDACASLDNVPALPNVTFVKGDILSGELVAFVLKSQRIDTVMHFAAHTHVDASFGNSLAFTMNNTYGTHVLLEACRQHGGIRRFINVSTDEVYGETSLGRATGLPECSRLDPTNPYSAAKAGAEMVARAYVTSYGLPVITTRSNNVYGPRQFPEKMIPKFALLASRDRALPVHGDGSATRSYLHVDDVAAAFDVILHKGVVGETYNIGSTEERTVLNVAADVVRLLDRDPSQAIVHVRDRAFNDRRYFIADDKLAQLGWVPRVPWIDGLRATVEWYTSHTSGWWDPSLVDGALLAHPTS